MLHILIDMPIHQPTLDQLRTLPDIHIQTVPYREHAAPLPAELLADPQILFCMWPPTNFTDCKALKWVQISSVGYSQLTNIGLNERHIRATNAQGVFDVPIAEWNMAMIFMLARDMRGMFHNQDNGIWDRSARFQTELRGLTIGLWGYGGIARETARLAKQMGLRVHVLVRNPIKARHNSFCVAGTGDIEGVLPDKVFYTGEETAFLSRLDMLVLAMPLTAQTRSIVRESHLRALPPTAFVLNPARGALIDEAVLLKALREKWIAGAALDTHYYYPMPPDHPLWQMPNVIMTPHISGSSLSPHYVSRTWQIFAENLMRFRTGQPLLNELSPAQLAGG